MPKAAFANRTGGTSLPPGSRLPPILLAGMLVLSGCEVSMPTLGPGVCSDQTLASIEAEESSLFADFLDAQAQCLRRVSGVRDYCDTWVDYRELQREIREAVVRARGGDCLLPPAAESGFGFQPEGYDRSTSPLRVLDGAFAKAGMSPYDR
jgi:hypothetical protein